MKNVLPTVAALLGVAGAASSARADTALVGQWHLDEGTGSTVSDSSGHGNNGTIVGSAHWVAGHSGTALSFDGPGAGVRVPDSSSLEPATAITVSAWVKAADSPGTYRYILGKGGDSCSTGSYGLYTGPTGGVEFYVTSQADPRSAQSPDPGTGIWDGNWHMVVGVYDGRSVRLYVDGSQIGTGTPHQGQIAYLLPDSNDVMIGGFASCLTLGFTGSIDEVTIFNEALTTDQVQSAFGNTGPNGTGNQTAPVVPIGPAGTGGAKPSGPPREVPSISRLTISPSAFPAALSRNRGVGAKTGPMISYIDVGTQPAIVSLSVLIRHRGIMAEGRCIARHARRLNRRARSCVTYAKVGGLKHADRAGPNSFRLVGIGTHALTRGSYLLQATPRVGRITGRTISTTFRITR